MQTYIMVLFVLAGFAPFIGLIIGDVIDYFEKKSRG